MTPDAPEAATQPTGAAAEQCSAAGLSTNRFMQTRWEHVRYTVKITMTSNGPVIVGLELQGVAILLGCLSAYSIGAL